MLSANCSSSNDRPADAAGDLPIIVILPGLTYDCHEIGDNVVISYVWY